ncbi:MAG: hypothetical protein BGO26_10330 [Actinobacteria bacterium 69-20]|jgi:diguanylate cyclase (GGDEF)-like protein|nr:MAG: hypothetical protein BGO26_10330 [Actinobacteria bacterium 69-20]
MGLSVHASARDSIPARPRPAEGPAVSAATGVVGSAATSVVDSAAACGVVDALVFRQIGRDTWAHVGGLGRGKGWAGIINLDETEGALALRIPGRVGEVYRERFAEPERLFGQIDATGGAVVRVSVDVAVALGNPTDRIVADDAQLLRLAQLVDAEIPEIDPSKQLADELAVLTAVRELMDAPIDCGLDAAVRHLTVVATKALSCEIGVLRDGSGTLTVVGDETVAAADWHRVMDDLESNPRRDPCCCHDTSSSPSRLLRELLPQTRPVLATRVPEPVGGYLLLIHTSANPRDFSLRCRRLARNIVETGAVVARTAILHDELHAAAKQASAVARTDPLTGLGNRLAWDEAIVQAQAAVDAGGTFSVVTLDVDGLKDINDRYGHNAGDDLLRRCAAVIRDHCSGVDLAVRLGGDEFAILVPHALGSADPRYVSFATALSGLRSTRDTVTASLGVCTVNPGGNVFDAVREADMQMYGNKRQRRTARAPIWAI